MSHPDRFPDPSAVMRHAMALAEEGVGFVEPNPPVGAVIVDADLNLIGSGFHRRFGGPHAEVEALHAAGPRAQGAMLYVTLEPCCHHGKTPPCTDAVIAAGIGEVIVSMQDPAPHASGRGIEQLKAAGIKVDVGLLHEQAARLCAPFVKLVTTGRPYVHAKWAMTLDGKIASRAGHSQWISNERSRSIVHALRGRMDAVIVGIGTALADDPLLTARPTGPRIATRIIVDSAARLPVNSRLVRSLDAAPALVIAATSAPVENVTRLRNAGVEVMLLPECPREGDTSRRSRIDPAALLDELGRRRMTNVLVEGGSGVLGTFFDADLIDMVHAFIAPKLVGGNALTPLGGAGLERIPEVSQLSNHAVEILDGDIYYRGSIVRRR